MNHHDDWVQSNISKIPLSPLSMFSYLENTDQGAIIERHLSSHQTEASHTTSSRYLVSPFSSRNAAPIYNDSKCSIFMPYCSTIDACLYIYYLT
jgi:hypothetical protein